MEVHFDISNSYRIQVALVCCPQNHTAAACQVTDGDRNVLVGLRVYLWQSWLCLEPLGMRWSHENRPQGKSGLETNSLKY